tara:strand:+ start:861 stop:1694 length:834 start_codon:yes stop_codon:yes gene_type:complete
MDSILNQELISELQTILKTNTGQILVVNPSTKLITSLTNLLLTSPNPYPLRIISDESLIKETIRNFATASHLSELSSQGILELRTATTLPRTESMLTSSHLVTFIAAGNSIVTLSTPSESLSNDVYLFYDDLWSQSVTFHMHTPPISDIKNSLDDRFGNSFKSDFIIALSSLYKLPSSQHLFDEIALSLLIAARNEVLLYDISRWAEDVGIASRATISRTKKFLEGANLITTENIPVRSGRPRLRLCMAHQSLMECPVENLLLTALELASEKTSRKP